MRDEISQEAKDALANLSKRKARERLHRDGAASPEATRRRIRAFAIEKAIPSGKIAKLMKGRLTMPRLVQFSKDYKVSLDWLLYGDLHGLAWMTRRQKEPKRLSTTRHTESC
jgi:hypothetical protein